MQFSDVQLTALKSTLDHVVPVAKGGTFAWENLVMSCTLCNNKKRDTQEGWHAGCRANKVSQFDPETGVVIP